MIVAFPLLGIFQVFVFIPIIPEIYERLTVELNIREGDDEYVDSMLNDKCNDTYGVVYAFSMFFAPNVGGYMYKIMGHRNSCDTWLLINLVSFAILFIFNGDVRTFSENRVF